jgi:glycosyltransferase involved in cell wall biosynthesis
VKNKLRVLCLDTEGGFGGSSRSLYLSILYLLRIDINIHIDVWCKKQGPIQNKYRDLGISVNVFPNMPKIRSVPLFTRNIFLMGKFFLIDWRRSKKFRKNMLLEVNNYDIVHCNHESLYWLARWISVKSDTLVAMHIRTNPWPSIFTRFQISVIDKYVNNLVFITENEKKTYVDSCGSEDKGVVIYNIVESATIAGISKLDAFDDDCFKVCVLSNYAYLRGTDRLAKVSNIIYESTGKTDILFVIAGKKILTKTMPGDLGNIAKNGGDLSDYIEKHGIGSMFLFLDHVTNPESVLSACNVLIRPSREYNPWGRDVLEALSFGVPVIATGKYNRFVKDGATGFLLDEFDSKTVAKHIIELSKNKEIVKNMGKQGRQRVEELCNGPDRAQDLFQFWQKIVEG